MYNLLIFIHEFAKVKDFTIAVRIEEINELILNNQLSLLLCISDIKDLIY
jgi:hypothetical protein